MRNCLSDWKWVGHLKGIGFKSAGARVAKGLGLALLQSKSYLLDIWFRQCLHPTIAVIGLIGKMVVVGG